MYHIGYLTFHADNPGAKTDSVNFLQKPYLQVPQKGVQYTAQGGWGKGSPAPIPPRVQFNIIVLFMPAVNSSGLFFCKSSPENACFPGFF
ncbi:MAG: hypothetical protein IJB41_01700, partial [Clostridia bacterium]|nr:hypothetical protein [Clostridia bacterium]